MKLSGAVNRRQFLNWRGYLLAAGLVALATLLGYLTKPLLSTTNTAMLYLLCVVATAILWGLGPSILACVSGGTGK